MLLHRIYWHLYRTCSILHDILPDNNNNNNNNLTFYRSCLFLLICWVSNRKVIEAFCCICYPLNILPLKSYPAAPTYSLQSSHFSNTFLLTQSSTIFNLFTTVNTQQPNNNTRQDQIIQQKTWTTQNNTIDAHPAAPATLSFSPLFWPLLWYKSFTKWTKP